MKEYNIVITGVGGQGVLTAANILGWAALHAGYKVRLGEVHGMSQRFGSVISYVRFGEDVYGSMVPEGKADVMLAFEPVEALRYINYLKEGMPLQLSSYKDEVVGVELPVAVELKVTDTGPGFKGDTASGGTKPATLETGITIQVPLFVNTGDIIKVDTRTGAYLERVS